MLDPGLFFMENWGFKMQEIHKHLAVFRSFLECWGCSSGVVRGCAGMFRGSPFRLLRRVHVTPTTPPPKCDLYPCGPHLPLAFILADPHLLCPQPLL